MSTSLDWMDSAACKDHPNPDAFFPTGVGILSRRQTAQAALICKSCPVQTQCADHKRQTGATSGVWAGGNHRPRKPRPHPIKHGTDSGYHGHMKRKETPCERCRFAHAWAERKRVEAKGLGA
jgi:WhiB family transcriptional regulator, redox-sensing transcriptional regulator